MTPDTHHDDETLMRRVDGELSPEAGAAIDAAAATDPVLAGRLDALRRLRSLAREAVPIGPDPRDQVLARLIAAGGSGRSSPVRLMDRLRDAFAPRHAPLWAGLAAAAFVGGLSLGWLGGGTADRGFAVGADGTLSDAGLIRVLDTRLTADGPDAEGRAVGLTFRDSGGRWCRTFSAGDAGVAGLACRGEPGEDGTWTLQVLAPFEVPGSGLRTAAADIPAPVLAAVDATLADDPLDAEAEARARDSNWR